MQSKTMSLIEVVTLTLATGSVATLANYCVLPLLWHLHTSVSDSAQMAVFFAAMSIVVKYPIRRFFNAIKTSRR